ncbi:MAG: anion permease [Selenomonadaceae bacterium]|nr:anion permease [Selenomonadaceae bacterium]
MNAQQKKKLAAVIIFGLVIWFCPHTEEITPIAWHLFAIFAATILGFILQPLPIGAVAFIGVTTAALTGVVTVGVAISGYGNSTIWLIICAFLLARAFIKSGLGRRISFLIIKAIGKSSLTLGYAITLSDFVISPATPSSTARAGRFIFDINLFGDMAGSPGNPRVAVINENTQQFNGRIYRRDENGRYVTRPDRQKHFLHLDVWKAHFGEPPEGAYILHRDDDPAHNDIENLFMMDSLEFLKWRREHSPLQIAVCKWCGAAFAYTTIGRKPTLCSEYCKNKFNRARYQVERECVICGRTFLTYKYHPKRTCSNDCRIKLAFAPKDDG